MEMSRYSGAAFLKIGDVKQGPIRVTITDVRIGKYDKPDLTFDDGSRLSANVTNCRALSRAYGTDSDVWVGKEVELYLGEIEYQDKMQETVLVKPVSPPLEKKSPKPKGRRGGDMDDEVLLSFDETGRRDERLPISRW